MALKPRCGGGGEGGSGGITEGDPCMGSPPRRSRIASVNSPEPGREAGYTGREEEGGRDTLRPYTIRVHYWLHILY